MLAPVQGRVNAARALDQGKTAVGHFRAGFCGQVFRLKPHAGFQRGKMRGTGRLETGKRPDIGGNICLTFNGVSIMKQIRDI